MARSCQADDADHYSDDEATTWLLLDTNHPRIATNEGIITSCFSYLKDPNHRPYRYAIAILLSFILGISSYTCEVPGGLQAAIIRVMRLDDAHYNMIFSAYTWADIVMSLVGSVIVNQYIGIHLGFIMFLTMIFSGQLLCAVGGFINSFWIFLLGRLIVGCGTGTSISILNSLQILWFEGKEITFIMSISRCFCRLFATLSLFTPQLMYESLTFTISSNFNRLGTTLMVGTVLCMLAVTFGLLVVALDRHGARVIGRRPPKKKNINLIDALRFPLSFWLIAIQCSLFYAITTSSSANGPLFIVSKYELSVDMASIANSLSYASIVFITPFIALAIDYYGYNLVWGLIGIGFAIASNIFYIVSGPSLFVPFLAATLSSCAYSFFGAAMWVTPGFIVEKHQITTAYGVTMSVLAVGISLVGLISGVIIDEFGYLVLLIFNVLILYFIVLLNLYVFVLDYCAEVQVLNVSGETRRKKHV